ncbi:Nn.00g039160.m01.CDS01 [Neocucurbitaria sp. VM-36]
MRYTAVSVVALAGVVNALPHPQLDLPFSLPFSLPTGNPLGGLLGGGFSIPSLPAATGIPSLGGGLGGLLPTGGIGLGSGTGTTAGAVVTPTSTVVASPTSTGSGGSGTVGSNCTPQGSSGGLGSTENGVTDKNCCTDMTVIFARGTGELGNVGSVAGPPMFKAIRDKLGADKVTVQGVNYAASAAGNANLGADGGKVMAQLVATALSQCPDTKIIVSGYSQGAMVVHNAFSNGLSSSQVAGAVMFGDPLKSQAISGLSTDKVKQFCGTADTICGGRGDGGATGSHLSYGSVADPAATFAIQAAGLA